MLEQFAFMKIKLVILLVVCLYATVYQDCEFHKLFAATQPDEDAKTLFEKESDETSGSLYDVHDIFYLMHEQFITSAAKKAQKISETSSAIFVITQDDIRRSGVTTIPEVLRMVPGLQVAQIDANKWAISSRGFNDRFADKLLVLIDGRTVYSPFTGGVYWDEQNMLLEDVERIEVIRGPGGSLWGANAVNGVINIITKSAEDTQGGFLIAGGGTEERGFGGFRYGSKLGNDIYYRIYSKYFDHDDFVSLSDDRAADEWDMLSAGFRIDWNLSDSNALMLNGDIYEGHKGQTISLSGANPYKDTTDLGGGHFMARWKHTFSEVSDMTTQFYFDRTERDGSFQKQIYNTVDIDLNHRFAFGNRQEILWGLGYRFIGDEIDDITFSSIFDQGTRSNHIFSAFLQDEITLLPDRFRLTIGSKLEYNDYTGFEVQPSARLLWTPNERHTVWAAISRAVVTPSRDENDIRVNINIPGTYGGPNILISIFGNMDFESQNLLAYEIGYRTQMFDQIFLDIAAFYNLYDNLQTVEPGEPLFNPFPQPGQLFLPQQLNNKMDGETYGVEIAANYQMTDYLRLAAGYTYLQEDFELDSSSGDTISIFKERNNPHHQFQFRSRLDLPHNLEFDTSLYYVDSLRNQDVSSYIRLDSRFGWHPTENVELSISLQNLLDPDHKEFGSLDGINATQVQRSIYGQITWSF